MRQEFIAVPITLGLMTQPWRVYARPISELQADVFRDQTRVPINVCQNGGLMTRLTRNELLELFVRPGVAGDASPGYL